MGIFNLTKLIGFGKMIVYAENVDEPGTYRAVQGQVDSNGYFVLLTSGTGNTTPTDFGNLLLENNTDSLLTEGGDFLTQQI
jgi:hypothetical protein